MGGQARRAMTKNKRAGTIRNKSARRISRYNNTLTWSVPVFRVQCCRSRPRCRRDRRLSVRSHSVTYNPSDDAGNARQSSIQDNEGFEGSILSKKGAILTLFRGTQNKTMLRRLFTLVCRFNHLQLVGAIRTATVGQAGIHAPGRSGSRHWRDFREGGRATFVHSIVECKLPAEEVLGPVLRRRVLTYLV